MKSLLRLCTVALLLVLGVQHADAQHVAVKTNLLYDATGSVNLGTEIALAPHWTLDMSSSFNDWKVYNDREWRHFLTQPEARYWLCNNFAGHFFALHAHYGRYNMGNIKNGIKFLGTNFEALTHNRFDGWLLGGGVGYGYAFVLGKHFNLEMELGVGYAYMEYNKYDWDTGVLLGRHDNHHYWGITKLNVGLSYIF